MIFLIVVFCGFCLGFVVAFVRIAVATIKLIFYLAVVLVAVLVLLVQGSIALGVLAYGAITAYLERRSAT
jgi:hypothetical protein